MTLNPLNLSLKAYIYGALIIAAILGEAGKDLWIYRQGQITGAGNEVKIQLQVRKEEQAEFNRQRELELRTARGQYERWKIQQLKKTKAVEDANRILNEQNQALLSALNSPVPDDLIGVLNGRITNFGQSDPSGGKPASGSDEKVPPTTDASERKLVVAEFGN